MFYDISHLVSWNKNKFRKTIAQFRKEQSSFNNAFVSVIKRF